MDGWPESGASPLGLTAEARVRLEHRPALAPLAVQVLKLLSVPQTVIDELVSEKAAANPVLAVGPSRRCRWCGLRTPAGYCRSCGPADLRLSVGEAAAAESASDGLRRAARAELPSRYRSLVDAVIACLDERGLLPAGVDGTASMLAQPVGDILLVVRAIRSVGPPGVAGRDALESLALQAAWHVARGAPGVLSRIVPEFLEAVAEGDHELIAKTLEISVEAVDEAVHFLRTRLRPFPVFEGTERLTAPPDVVIRRHSRSQDTLVVHVSGAADMGLHVDDELVDVARNGDESARAWLGGRVRDAKEFVDLIDRRAATLRRVVSTLVAVQAGFVLQGPEHHVAMTRTSLAASLGLHPSTVSRAVQGKVARLPDGRFEPLGSFFGQAIDAKAILRSLLLEPHSTDTALAARLAEAGHAVARRTVAKYRRQLERSGAVKKGPSPPFDPTG